MEIVPNDLSNFILCIFLLREEMCELSLYCHQVK